MVLGVFTYLMNKLVGADSFLFWLFLFGALIASFQDLKRREVDNWLNFFLLVFGVVFISYRAFFEKDFSLVLRLIVILATMFGAMNLFYYGRVFAGGDAKLLFGMSALFVGGSYLSGFVNVGIFLFLLMFSGSIYGLFYSGVLYFRNFKKSNKEIRKMFRGTKWIRLMLYLGGVFFILSLVYHFIFGGIMIVAILGIILLFPMLFLFSKTLEKVCMIREISGKELREGDWIFKDIRVGKKTIKSNWEGLSEDEIKILRNKKKVVIKDGLPFVPAFLIALLLYEFFRNFIVGLFSVF